MTGADVTCILQSCLDVASLSERCIRVRVELPRRVLYVSALRSPDNMTRAVLYLWLCLVLVPHSTWGSRGAVASCRIPSRSYVRMSRFRAARLGTQPG